MVEQKRRSVAKALSWRITATTTTTIISFFITGNVSAALKIGAAEAIAKMALYYFQGVYGSILSSELKIVLIIIFDRLRYE